MNVIVPLKQVPDLVEELEINADGTDIDRELVKFVLNEWDGQALEEALLIKDSTGAAVTVVALDDPDVDPTLYTAVAKGADRAVKLTGVPEGWVDSHARAGALGAWIRTQPCDVVLTGVQAPDDLDGQTAPLLAHELGWPYVSVVISVDAKEGSARVTQEFGGGTAAELDVPLPAVLGIQVARQAPRYAPISRVRQAQQAGGIEEMQAEITVRTPALLQLKRLFAPEKASHAEMLGGGADEVAGRIVELMRARGLLT